MITYYGSRISDNMVETPEGYLITRNVPIARTGSQEYLSSELGLDGNKVVNVLRNEDEVFSKATLASFESKPSTNDHPTNPVSIDDVHYRMKGITTNVRRGEGEDADKIVADITWYDKDTIKRIKDGKREISCGYDCVYVENNDGTYSQTQIRGNHVALVDKGRAGDKIAIKDNDTIGGKKMEKKESLLTKLLKPFVKDADPADVAELVENLLENKACAELPMDEEPKKEEVVVDEETPSDDPIAKLTAMVEALATQVATLTKKEEPAVDELESLEKELSNDEDAVEEKKEEGSEVVDADETEEVVDEDPKEEIATDEEPEEEKKTAMDKAVLHSIVKDMRPLIANLPEAERKAFTDVLVNNTKKKATNDGYNNIIKVKEATSVKTNDTKDLGKQIMAKYNPHYKEVK